MLQRQSVNDELLELLRFLMTVNEFNDFRLVGGTSLALQWGHRNSIDIYMLAAKQRKLFQTCSPRA